MILKIALVTDVQGGSDSCNQQILLATGYNDIERGYSRERIKYISHHLCWFSASKGCMPRSVPHDSIHFNLRISNSNHNEVHSWTIDHLIDRIRAFNPMMECVYFRIFIALLASHAAAVAYLCRNNLK